MNWKQDGALTTLAHFRRDLAEAEARGWADSELLARAGGLASMIKGAGLDDCVAEANNLYHRAMKLKVRY